MDENYKYRVAEIDDLKGIVLCHIYAFPGRFQTEMGSQWLSDLYRYYIEHQEGIVVVVANGNDNILGFSMGGKPGIVTDFFNKAVHSYMISLFLKFLTKSIVRKTILNEVLTRFKLRFTKKSNISSSVPPRGTYGELLSIAVLPECKGKGIASNLLNAFVKSMPEHYSVLRLTVLTNNTRAIKFYVKNGGYEVGRREKSIKLHYNLKD